MTNTKTTKTTKAAVYAAYGIEYRAGKIASPLGWVSPLLVDGNSKLGRGVWTFSTLPGTGYFSAEVDGQQVEVRGTCPCSCSGCYAQTGFYRMPSVILSNALRTVIAREHLGFMVRAISAQVAAEGIALLRIHASGDFFSPEYVDAWRQIAAAAPGTLFWSYTKNAAAEEAFKGLQNVNIVRSVVPGLGFNFGPCGYILRAYEALRALGKDVYICRCGIDPDQHCVNCRGCSRNAYVLFIEHSTSYRAADDPDLPKLREIIESQPKV